MLVALVCLSHLTSILSSNRAQLVLPEHILVVAAPLLGGIMMRYESQLFLHGLDLATVWLVPWMSTRVPIVLPML